MTEKKALDALHCSLLYFCGGCIILKLVITRAAYRRRLQKTGYDDRHDAGWIVQRAHACDPISRRMQALGVDPFANGSYMLPVKGDEFQKYCKYITRKELRIFRDERWLSRSDIAKFFNVSETRVGRWMKRTKNDDDFLPILRQDFERLQAAYPENRSGGRWHGLMKKNGFE